VRAVGDARVQGVQSAGFDFGHDPILRRALPLLPRGLRISVHQ
jgi:hypothetical protein